MVVVIVSVVDLVVSSSIVDIVGDVVLFSDVYDNVKVLLVFVLYVIDICNDYFVILLMKDVILCGIGVVVCKFGCEDLVGKIGLINDYCDVWFVGFNGDLFMVVWVGFDDFSLLGCVNGVGEFGVQVVLLIWMDYMGSVFKGLLVNMLFMLLGIIMFIIDWSMGLFVVVGDINMMLEMFKVEDLDKLCSQVVQQQQEQDKQYVYDIF